MKILSRLVLIVLGLVLAGLAFIYFAPGYNLYFVRSESMRPTVNIGDIIITGPVGGFLSGGVESGKIITFEVGKSLVTHRVLSVNGNTMVTKGDALEDPDSRPVPISQVRGIYLFKIPYVGYMSSLIRTRLGWWLAILVPATALVLVIVKDIIKEALRSS